MMRQLKPNSAPGPDGITPRMLQELVDEVAAPLGNIFTKSMEEGLVPEDWRTANITPTYFQKGTEIVDSQLPSSVLDLGPRESHGEGH